MDQNSRIYVVGQETLIGSALMRVLRQEAYSRLIEEPFDKEEITDPARVERFFAGTKPEYVFLAGGKSGGIYANEKYPADLMGNNLLLDCQIIQASYRQGVKKLLYFSSCCCYPKHCPQRMCEEALLTGPLEPTSEAYALAKIAGMQLCKAYREEYGANFISAIPANLFGPGDDFHAENSHVIAALIRKMHQAKEERALFVEIWGTGKVKREFVYIDDTAEAAIWVMNRYEDSNPINLGGGFDLTIEEAAREIKAVVGFSGSLRFDPRRTDGMPSKLLDSSKLRKLGWRPRTRLREALEITYSWYLETKDASGKERENARSSTVSN